MKNVTPYLILLLTTMSIFAAGCTKTKKTTGNMNTNEMNSDVKLTSVEQAPDGKELASFAGGCFWCTEAIFEEVKGVEKVISGYAGGKLANPTYEQVSNGNTGHTETIQITYDPKIVSYDSLLDMFMRTHDPTTLNRQGNDAGTQYRSAIFYHNAEQQKIAENYIAEKNADNYFGKKIVTEVVPFTIFYAAENYHQDYFAKNPDQPYCQFVVAKKVEKFEELFPQDVKEQYK